MSLLGRLQGQSFKILNKMTSSVYQQNTLYLSGHILLLDVNKSLGGGGVQYEIMDFIYVYQYTYISSIGWGIII